MSIVDELSRLYAETGDLSPEAVVAEAVDTSSALHVHFEWDDSEAGRQYRLVQARDLIRSCRITIEKRDETVTRVRAFVSVADVGYIPTADALVDDASREVVLQQARRDLAALRRKYNDLLDFEALLRSATDVETAA